MPLRIGVLLYPAALVAIQLARPNAVVEFEKAEAFSPDSGRKPGGLGVPMKAVSRAVRRGMLVATGDGRYYIDRAALKRSDRITAALMTGATLGFLAALWFMFR